MVLPAESGFVVIHENGNLVSHNHNWITSVIGLREAKRVREGDERQEREGGCWMSHGKKRT